MEKQVELCERIIAKVNKNSYELIHNNPKKINSLDSHMYSSMLYYLNIWFGDTKNSNEIQSLNKTNKIKILIHSGEGKSFSSGGNLAEFLKEIKINNNKQTDMEYLLAETMKNKVPIKISFWKGAVMGGSVGNSIYSTFKISTDSTLFAMPEAKIGFFTDLGATYFLTRSFKSKNSVIPELGLFYGLTSEKCSGLDVLRFGLSDYYVKIEKYDLFKEKLIIFIDSLESSLDVDSYKNEIKAYLDTNCDDSFEKTNLLAEDFPHFDLIRSIFKLDSINNVLKRLDEVIENGNDNQKSWANEIKKIINSNSPNSEVIIFELLKRGLYYKNQEEAWKFECELTNKYLKEKDFSEGIRALIIDKDNKPNWESKSILEVDINELLIKYSIN